MLLLAGALIAGGNIHNTVCIDIKGDLNLRHTSGRCGNTVQAEAAESGIAGCHIALALQNMNFHRGLVVGSGGINLALLHRNRGIAVDDAVENTAQSLNTERQRRNIKQQQILDIAAEYAALNRSADCNAFIRVDPLERLFAHKLLNGLLHGRDTGRTADKQHLINLRGTEACVGHSLLHRSDGRIDQVARQFIEFCTRQRCVKVFRAGCRRDKGQINIGGCHAGKLNLRFFGSILQSLQCHLVLTQVNAAVIAHEFLCHPVDDTLVKVVAAQTIVAGSCKHFKDTVGDFKDGDIECAAAQVKNHDLLLLIVFVNAVCKRSGSRLVNNTKNIKACDLAGILGCLALCIGEVCRNGDDRLRNGCAEICLGIRFQLLQDHRGDFLRGIFLRVDRYLIVRAHVALDGHYGAIRVCDRLSLCNGADHTAAVFCKCNNARCGSCPLGICDNRGLAALIYSNTRICRAKVNSDNFSHNQFLLSFVPSYNNLFYLSRSMLSSQLLP